MFSEVTRALKALVLLVVATVVAGCAPALQDTGQVSTVDTAVFVERDIALAYDARTGVWEEAVFSVLSGDELLYDGHLFKVSDDGLVDRGAVELWELYPADAPFDAALDDDALPTSDEWVLIFGDDAESGHRRFGSVQPGERFAYFGRVHATRAAADGVLEVRQTGEVLSEVAATFVRHAAMLLEAELVREDGSVSTVSATGGHPFYVPAEDTYRPLEELEVGTELRLVGGGTAVVRAVREVPGDVEVFNFEVVGQHNYFAGDAAVAVHNGGYKCRWRTPAQWAQIDADAVRDTMRPLYAGYESGRHGGWRLAAAAALREMADKADLDEVLPDYGKRLREIADTHEKKGKGAKHRGGFSRGC